MRSDPIADMLTRIRNASRAEHEKVDIPASRLKVRVAEILKDEGFIKNFRLLEDTKRSEEHTSELQSQSNLVCRLLLEKKKKKDTPHTQRCSDERSGYSVSCVL